MTTPSQDPTVRPAVAADRDSLRAVADAVHRESPRLWVVQPDADDALTDYTVVCDGRSVRGFGWTTRWTETDDTRLHLLLGWIAPPARGAGLGRALLARQLQDATHTAALERIGRPVAGINVDAPGAASLVARAGFRLAFTGVTMVTRPTRQQWSLPEGLAFRPVRPEDHRAIHAAITESFAGARHGQLPFGFDKYQADFGRADTEPWRVVWDGSEVAGVAITTITDGAVDTPWVAVRPGWRRRGIGRALMRSTVDGLARRGLDRASIDTVLENADHSVELYRRVGYEITERRPRFRRPLP